MGAMGIGGLLNSRNSNAVDAQMRRHLQQTMHMDPHSAYGMDHQSPMGHHPHPHPHQHPMTHPNQMSFANMGGSQHPQMMPTNFMTPHSSAATHTHIETETLKPKTEPAPKAFACGTCNKGFARRSDLARHERIHSGVRPHACDFPGCGKQFIQRSALTVHARVHTGEKPHMCERCGKPFSDSSSLARHRRIHSGKRPYQCPFANCQKTFTRRTTLTRHQNNHAGTVEQAEAETNAKLALTQPQGQPRSNQSSYSDAVSRTSTVSPARPLTISPNHEIPSMSSLSEMQKSNSEFSYLSQTQMLPPHMRTNFHPSNVRVSQSLNAPAMPSFTNAPHPGPQLTSHPSSFRSTQSLESSTTLANDGTASPTHMSNLAWPGDNGNNGLAGSSGMDPYQYQDNSSFAGHQLYYPGSNIRRPQSTEPEDYGIRQRYMGHHMNAGGMPMSAAEWNPMPMNIHEVKQERTYAG